MKSLIGIFMLVGLVLVPSYAAATSSSCVYCYSDDFSTNIVEADSYEHSPILDQPPLDLPSWLMYVTNVVGNRGLGFCHGDEPGEMAILKYMFPLGGSSGVTTGVLDFEFWSLSDSSPGYALVSIGYDSTTTAIRLQVPLLTPIKIIISPLQLVSKVYVTFSGASVALDYVSICLDVTTPIRGYSWAKLKSLYR